MKAESLGANLKELRLGKGLTQRGLAKDIGSTAASISAYETGLKYPSLVQVVRLAEYFNVSMDWLCGGPEGVCGSKVSTYADVLQLLFTLSAHVTCTLNGAEGVTDSKVAIEFFDGVLSEFIFNWSKNKKLYDDGVIDKDLYDLWVEKQLEVYSKINLT